MSPDRQHTEPVRAFYVYSRLCNRQKKVMIGIGR